VKAAGFTAAWPMVALPVGERAPAGEATADRDGWNAGSPVRTERASARRENPPISGSGPTEEQSAGPRTEPGETRSAGSEDGPPLFYAYDAPPRVTHAITPEYPAAARSAGAEGTVIVNVNVDEHGRVTRAWVATAEAPESLIEAALDASYQFVFAAGTMRNVPVPCTVAIPFQFSLRRTFQDQ
jgi:TonB family protein